MLAGRMLIAAGLAVPDGPLTVAPVSSQHHLVLSADDKKLYGKVQRVPWGATCPHAVVVTTGSEVALVRTDMTARAAERNLAGEPRVCLEFEGTPVVAATALHGAADRLELEGALCRSVQIAGALERILAYSLQYANERVQFGRPIGKFQAVQHMLALLAGHAAAASAAANAAVEASRVAPGPLAVAAAKARCGEAAGKGAEIAHQVHGAMGYTREHNLHYCTRRLWSWRDEFGNEARWQAWIGHFVVRQGADALWPMLTAA
jgi:acyl-CoA dehydrogenase